MSTWEQIAEVRTRINDPEGVVNLVQVDTVADLPATPVPYTYYNVKSTGAYVTKEDGETEYSTLPIRISDARIESWIDAGGVDYAECMSYGAIASRIGNEMMLKKAQVGAESTEYQSLNDVYRYYKAVSEDCNKRRSATAGRYVNTVDPEIAGGNL
jgi:hypothetical protein